MRQQTSDGELTALGRDLDRLRRRCRRLRRTDWASWSAAIGETNALARRIGQVAPTGLADVVIRYDALHWLMLEQDDVIMDVEARRAFVAFGRALRQLVQNDSRSGPQIAACPRRRTPVILWTGGRPHAFA